MNSGMDYHPSRMLPDYKIGDTVVFCDRDNVYSGVVKAKMPPYLLVETGDSLWRVLVDNIQSHTRHDSN